MSMRKGLLTIESARSRDNHVAVLILRLQGNLISREAIRQLLLEMIVIRLSLRPLGLRTRKAREKQVPLVAERPNAA